MAQWARSRPQRREWQGDEAVLVPLAPADMDQHPAGVDVGDLQMERLLQPQPQGIDGPEEALQAGLADGGDQLIDFGDGQHGGQLELLGDAQLLERGPFPRAGVAIEELESGVGDLEGIAFPLLVVLDEQQVASQVVFGGQVGRLVEPLGELADRAEVGFVSPLAEARPAACPGASSGRVGRGEFLYAWRAARKGGLDAGQREGENEVS